MRSCGTHIDSAPETKCRCILIKDEDIVQTTNNNIGSENYSGKGKSQFTSFVFIYKTLMYCYYSKSDINYTVIYFPLEETPVRIMERFMSWLLFDLTNGKTRISPRDLRSTNKPCSQEILDMINSDEFQDILK